MKYKFDLTAAVLGGDDRELEIANILVKRKFEVRILKVKENTDNKKLCCLQSPARVLDGADIVIFPVSGINDEGYLNKTYIGKKIFINENLLKLSKDNALFFTGIAGDHMKRIINNRGAQARLIELLEDDEVAILNSIPTAEGVVQKAMELSDITIHSSCSFVLGAGRCGLTLIRLLSNMGAEVTAAARRSEVRARIKEMGIRAVSFYELNQIIKKAEFIFNTIPAMIMGEELLKNVNRKVLILDIASSPGGVDFETASRMGIRALLTPGLPGKVAPKTAGNILGRVILQKIKEVRKNQN